MPKGRRQSSAVSVEKRVTSPLWAALVGGVLGISGALGGAYLTTKASTNLALDLANRQSEKERGQLEDSAIRSLLTLAARSVASAHRAADQLPEDKDFQRDVPEPHETLIDEAMLFSPLLSQDSFGLSTKIIQVIGTAEVCRTHKQVFEMRNAAKSSDQMRGGGRC